jgi:hypothetical protein
MREINLLTICVRHLFKFIGLIAFTLVAIGSGTGTQFQTIPGKSLEASDLQAGLSLNGGLVLIGRDSELRDVSVYATKSSEREQELLEDACRNRQDYVSCVNRLGNFLPDANRGKKYYFRNGIAISEAELEQLRQQRREIIKQQQEAANRARQEAASRAQQEAQARLQEAERIRVQNIKPKLNTTD